MPSNRAWARRAINAPTTPPMMPPQIETMRTMNSATAGRQPLFQRSLRNRWGDGDAEQEAREEAEQSRDLTDEPLGEAAQTREHHHDQDDQVDPAHALRVGPTCSVARPSADVGIKPVALLVVALGRRRSLLGLHANASVDTDGRGVHVTVGEQLDRERRELARVPEPLREEDARAETRLELIRCGTAAVDRGVDEPGQDAVRAHADRGDVTCERQREPNDAALRGRVRDLADLAVLGGDRRGVHDRAAVAVGVGRRCGSSPSRRGDRR